MSHPRITMRASEPVRLTERKPGPAVHRYTSDHAAQMLAWVIVAGLMIFAFVLGVQVGMRQPKPLPVAAAGPWP